MFQKYKYSLLISTYYLKLFVRIWLYIYAKSSLFLFSEESKCAAERITLHSDQSFISFRNINEKASPRVMKIIASSRLSVSSGHSAKNGEWKHEKKRGDRKRKNGCGQTLQKVLPPTYSRSWYTQNDLSLSLPTGAVSLSFATLCYFLFFRALFSALRSNQLNAWKRLYGDQ